VTLAQDFGNLFADDYDEVRDPADESGDRRAAVTSAQAVGGAVRAAGARRHRWSSRPIREAVNERAHSAHFQSKHGLETRRFSRLGATDSYAIGQLGRESGADAFRFGIDRPEIERFCRVPGGNFPDDGPRSRLRNRSSQGGW